VQTLFTLDHVVSQGNTTANTVQFTNPTTSLTATGNVEVGGELSVSGNATVSQELSVSANVELSSNLTVSGNVGIGTDSPSTPLHVYSDAGVSPFVEVARFETNHGDFDDSTILADGGYLSFHTNDVNAALGEVARIGWRCDNEGNQEDDGMLEFHTKKNDTLNRVVTISADGNIGIGTDKAEHYSRMHIYHNEEQDSTHNHFVNYIDATITGSTALTAYRYAYGFKTDFETQFSGSSSGARHTVKGVDSYVFSSGTANPHYIYGVEGAARTRSTGTISYVVAGGRFYGYQEAAASQPVQSLVGLYAQCLKYGTGDVTYAIGVTSEVSTTSGNVSTLRGVNVGITNAGSAITDSFQLKGATNQTSGSIANNYGLHLSSNQNLDHYMEARDVQWRTPYNTNQRHLHLNKTTADFAQNMNYTHYATQTSGTNLSSPDSAEGLWMGNFTDENWTGHGRNFIAWTSRLQLYNTSDITDFEDTLSFTSNSDTLLHAGTAFDKVGYFDGATANSDLNNFTGQHRCLVEEVRHDQAEEHEGLIVCANKNEYFKMSGGTDFTFTVNEALPLVSLSTKVMDKSCFGVISSSEDPENRVDRYGTYVAQFPKEKGDTRIYINSVGEGGIWVVNTNGHLESGDYITTSNVAGYGMRQDDDILHNYSVAKITMDCDFNPVNKPVKRIVRTQEDYDVWYAFSNITFAEYSNTAPNKTRTFEETYYTVQKRKEITKSEEPADLTLYIDKESDAELSEEEWNALDSEERMKYDIKLFKYVDVEVSPEEYPEATMHTTRYQKIVDKTDVLPKNEKDATKFTYKQVEQRWVNVLDEHGQLQWEDHPTETEKAYKIRYLTADGTQTDEANAVHIAAFVGCTYHCG